MLFMLMPALASANTDIQLFLDGKKLSTNIPPRIVNNSTLVPIRLIAESLGSSVSWNKEEQKVSVHKEQLEINLHIGKRDADVNGTSYKLDTPPVIQEGTTLLPLRFVSEKLGVKVSWDALTRSVHLYQEQVASNPDNGGDTGTTTPTDPSVPDPEDGTGHDHEEEEGTTTPPVLDSNPALIQFISIQDGEVLIDTDKQINFKHFTLENPNRIVIDLPNTQFYSEFLNIGTGADQTLAGETLGNGTLIQKVRYSVFSDAERIVRVVIDLNQKSAYNVTYNDAMKQISIKIGDHVQPDPVNKKYKIVIDAGHGGKDPGASGKGTHNEKQFNLAVALKVQKLLLLEPKLQVIMTREGDTYPTLTDRSSLANNINADLFISIHGNSTTNNTTNGTETYFRNEFSKTFAYLLHKNLVQATKLVDRGIRNGNFHVIRETKMPAVLIEAGYLSNASEEAQLFNEQFQQRVAASIVLSIKQYFKI